MFSIGVLSEGAGGGQTELLWLLYAGIALFLLLVAVGWWSGSGKQNQVEAGHEAHVEVQEKKPDVKKTQAKAPLKKKKSK